VIYLPIDHLAPFGTRVFQVGAQLSLSPEPSFVRLPSESRWLRPGKFIESDNPQVKQLAAELRGAEPLQSAKRILKGRQGRILNINYLDTNSFLFPIISPARSKGSRQNRAHGHNPG
jgi:hypothetical protein